MKCKYCNSIEEKLDWHHYSKCKDYRLNLRKIESSITKDFLEKEYIEAGKSLAFIAKELGLLKTTIIQKKLKEFGMPKRTLQEAKKQKHHVELAKETSLERYGVEFHLSKGSHLLEKGMATLAKMGVTNNFQREDVKVKIKESCLKKYGTEFAMQAEEVKETLRNSVMQKYGVDNPWKDKTVINKCIQTKIDRNKQTCYYSKQSQDFFWKIYSELPKELQEHTYFGDLNKEFGKYDTDNNCYYFYDFVITNINYCLEYNGNFYHANPKIYESSFYNKHTKMNAEEIWKKDKVKLDLMKSLGYTVDICWENEEDSTYSKIMETIEKLKGAH